MYSLFGLRQLCPCKRSDPVTNVTSSLLLFVSFATIAAEMGPILLPSSTMLAHERVDGVVVGLLIYVRLNPSSLPFFTKPTSSPPYQFQKLRYWSKVAVSLLRMVLSSTPTLATAGAIGMGYLGGGAGAAGVMLVTLTTATTVCWPSLVHFCPGAGRKGIVIYSPAHARSSLFLAVGLYVPLIAARVAEEIWCGYLVVSILSDLCEGHTATAWLPSVVVVVDSASANFMLALKHDHQIINRFDVFGYHGDMVVFEGVGCQFTFISFVFHEEYNFLIIFSLFTLMLLTLTVGVIWLIVLLICCCFFIMRCIVYKPAHKITKNKQWNIIKYHHKYCVIDYFCTSFWC